MFPSSVRILGIETSCDETSIAVVDNGTEVLSNVINSSVPLHQATGGVVPEVAARDAAKKIIPVLKQALAEAKIEMTSVDAIAVTAGPGLAGSLLVGIQVAKTLAFLHKKPLIPVNHITGHICSGRLLRSEEPDFPAMVLTVSGGHNDLVLWKGEYEFEILGRTLDDAAGEAFDKGARLLGLGFPGGPEIARVAESGIANAYHFPRPMIGSGNDNFSFSGLKTALLYTIQDLVKKGEDPKGEGIVADLSASYQEAICDTLARKLFDVFDRFEDVEEVYVTGGVSANRRLREILFLGSHKRKIGFHFPEKLEFCTDNGAMIAGAAYWKYRSFPEKTWDWELVEPVLHRELF
ncbi:tRNA (adenosine(37)-N6)-threonylcarbamoyltransferase complex transferase subunit TsaD [Candidatus Peregrinibacteria bacterium]|nr:MAG: tRNA (adenosine(37)-N6)-threonylcarbamoyltransferase complex transferase subunit TsaD [Candidatus Peregrinibacteria bacterium]